MDGIGDSRIGPTALNHGWHLAHAVCSLLEKTERILEAPERNLTSLGSFWCNRIVGISLETFVFRKKHFPCTHVDIWALNVVTFLRETGTVLSLLNFATIQPFYYITKFLEYNLLEGIGPKPSHLDPVVNKPRYTSPGALYYLRNGPSEMCPC